MSPSSKAGLIRHSIQIKRQIALVKEQKGAPVSLMWALDAGIHSQARCQIGIKRGQAHI